MAHTAVLFTALVLPNVSGSGGDVTAGISATDDTIAKQAVRKVEAINQPCSGSVVAVTPHSITILPGEGGRARKFVANATLASGDYPRDQVSGCRYRLTQVEVNDVVAIEYSRINGVEICDSICIRRRPGGRVPPGNYPPDQVIKPHELAQAYQDWEERGIPIPDLYHPRGNQIGVAPPPREVFPKIPPSKD